MKSFESEFRTLDYVISRSERILLMAHDRPDPDSVGANGALEEYIKNLGKSVDIICFYPYPDNLKRLGEKIFLHPDQVDLSSYDTIIACDSVDRGFDRLRPQIDERQVVALLDHHPDITVTGDIVIIDPEYSSTCELVYLFLKSTDGQITKSMASFLLTGIIFDTGGFQHSHVSPRLMEIASDLMKKGAPLAKITGMIFAHQKISALKLWGKAFEKARLNKKSGMLVTAITQEDVAEAEASVEDIYQVASILSTVPDAKFSLVLSERDNNIVRASLRSIEDRGVDVSAIAHQFGGGGHKLASGFELPGKIIETQTGWQIA